MAVTIHVSQCKSVVGAIDGVVVLQDQTDIRPSRPGRGLVYSLPMASRQCAVTPGLLDIIVSGRMISGGKPLYQCGQPFWSIICW